LKAKKSTSILHKSNRLQGVNKGRLKRSESFLKEKYKKAFK